MDPDGYDIIYGFLNGMIDVFPQHTLPQFCRSNITQAYWAVFRLFVNFEYNLSQEDDFRAMVYAIQDLF